MIDCEQKKGTPIIKWNVEDEKHEKKNSAECIRANTENFLDWLGRHLEQVRGLECLHQYMSLRSTVFFKYVSNN